MRLLFRLIPALLLPLVAVAQTKSIHLPNQLIQTPPPAPALQSSVAAAATKENPSSGLFLLQFTESVRPEWQAQLESLGVDLLRYVPDDAFIVRLKNVPAADVRGLPFVRWLTIVPSQAAFEIAPHQCRSPNTIGTWRQHPVFASRRVS
jgi:hypothetical protein